MKKSLIALAALLLLLLAPACAGAMRTSVLVYMSGSDLESEAASATADLREMIAAGIASDGEITILVETGGAEKWHTDGVDRRATQIHRVTGEGLSRLETLPLRNMGDGATLSEFLAYARTHFPAQRTLLILWGHGDGPDGGVCFDDLHDDDSLTPEEIAEALTQAREAGQRVDAVVLDACLMNCADLLNAFGPCTDYIVASQASTLSTGCNYRDWLSHLSQAPDIETGALCARIAQGYVQTARHGAFTASTTISVLDARRADALWRAVENLYARLCASLPEAQRALFAARAALTSFDEEGPDTASNLVDALQLCNAFESLAPGECAALRAAVENAVAFCESSGAYVGNACGLSLYMPDANAQRLSLLFERYRPLCKESAYARLIVHMAELARDGRSGNSGHVPAVDRFHIWQGLDEARPYAGRLWAGLDESRPYADCLREGRDGSRPYAGRLWGGLDIPAAQRRHCTAGQGAASPGLHIHQNARLRASGAYADSNDSGGCLQRDNPLLPQTQRLPPMARSCASIILRTMLPPM